MEITDCINILGYSYHLASSHLEFPLESFYSIMQNKQDELHKMHYIMKYICLFL